MPKPVGRPKREISHDQVYELAKRQWRDCEIAAFFDVHADTLHKNYSDIIDKGRQEGCGILRDLIWKRGLGNSDKMLALMAKQYLKFTETVNQRVIGAVTTIHDNQKFEEIEAMVSDMANWNNEPSAT